MSSTKAYSPPSGGRGVRLKPNQFLLPSGALITEIPILYSTPMIQANLDHRKTMTRRTRGLKDIPDFKFDRLEFSERFGPYACLFEVKIKSNPDSYQVKYIARSPYGKPGDLLWFRETFHLHGNSKEGQPIISYKAQALDAKDKGWSWKPSIHMPKAAARIWAMVEDIRVERVQDISEEDARAEGIESWNLHHGEQVFRNYLNPDSRGANEFCSFWSLWVSINGHESWNANPWVWVIRYRILSKTGRPSLDLIEQNYLEVTNPPRVSNPLEGSERKEVSNA